MKIKELRKLFNDKNIQFRKTTKLTKLEWYGPSDPHLHAYYIYFNKDDVFKQEPQIIFITIIKFILKINNLLDPEFSNGSFVGASIKSIDGNVINRWVQLDKLRLYPRNSKNISNMYKTEIIRKYCIRRII